MLSKPSDDWNNRNDKVTDYDHNHGSADHYDHVYKNIHYHHNGSTNYDHNHDYCGPVHDYHLANIYGCVEHNYDSRSDYHNHNGGTDYHIDV